MKSRHRFTVLICFVAMTLHTASSQSWMELYHRADSLSDLEKVEELPRALDLANTSLEKAEQQFGQADTRLVPVLELIAALHESGSRSSLTIGLCKQAIIVDLLENGSGHPDEALPFAQRALGIREQNQGPDDPAVARSLQLVASNYFVLGRVRDAIPLVERTVRIYQNAGQIRSRNYAFALHNLGFLYHNTGRYEEAGVKYRAAVDLMREILDPDDPYFCYPLTFLAVNYWALGLTHEAEEPLKEALRSWQSIYGPESPRSGICMGNLAQQYTLQGKFKEAAQWESKSFGIMTQGLKPDDPISGRAWLGLGLSMMNRQDYTGAISTFERALDLWNKGKTPEPRTIWTTELIGKCHLALRDYARAESDFLRALSMEDSLYGPRETPNTSICRNLANVYLHTGRLQEADSLFRIALKEVEDALGPAHPGVASVLDQYVDYFRLRHDFSRAIEISRRAVAIRERNFRQNARMMSERDGVSFSVFLRQSLNNYFSGVLDARLAGDPEEVAGVILGAKGEAAEQTVLRNKALVAESDSATLALAEEYRYARYQLATLYVQGQEGRTHIRFREEIDSLEQSANDLEAALARKSASFAQAQHEQTVTVDAIASHLPTASTLVEYLKIDYIRLNPDTLIPRYLALTISPAGKPRITDLGDADSIDTLIEAYRGHLAARAATGSAPDAAFEKGYRAIASRLFNLIWKPLNVATEGTMFIAPDGGLNLVSFAGLIDHDGRYLIEKYPVQYLSAGRDLLRFEDRDAPASGLIAFGDPDFDATVAERISSLPQVAVNTARDNRYGNVRSGCEQLNEMTVSRLYNTRSEVESIAGFWRDRKENGKSEALVGSQASEERFKRGAAGKRVIHLATHGYYLRSDCMPAARNNSIIGENPLLQSGLLLAGANLHGAGAREANAEDGVVTALEVSAMDLRGTDLVVLSACETGLGKVEQGEGVYGLRRAFQMAGAKTVVSSLWQVPDAETMKFMKTLYSAQAKTYPKLMQQVALKSIREARLRGRPVDPFTWGAFVATGDWRIH